MAILHLLVALATHFRAPIRLPEHVSVQVVVVRVSVGRRRQLALFLPRFPSFLPPPRPPARGYLPFFPLDEMCSLCPASGSVIGAGTMAVIW